ncbi:MAG: dihydrofolate reductase [Bacteroidota bacterium]
MKIKNLITSFALSSALLVSCSGKKEENNTKTETVAQEEFEYEADRFADIQVLRYQVKGFEELSLQQKQLAYYLSEAALCGRDIIFDQKNKYNLALRHTIDAIYTTYTGDKNSEAWKNFETYAKQVWYSHGNHHHYSQDKILPLFSVSDFKDMLNKSKKEDLPLEGKTIEEFSKQLEPVIFDAKFETKLVNLSKGVDNVKMSFNNFYEGVTQKEVENFYAPMIKNGGENAVAFGLNSKVTKENGKVVEKVWKQDGMYDAAITKIVYWLEKAVTVAENPAQKSALELLVNYYKTGDLKTWDDYNIAWVKDTASRLDVVNGFIEVYGDAIGKKGSFESCVSMKDMEASKVIATIASEAQWFEDNSPIAKEHKKEKVNGISAKVITVIQESGDAAPSTPIGINLPNSNWIREIHGSKSVSLGNIVESYNVVGAKSPSLKEFAFNDEIIERAKKHGALSGMLHTDMHEVIGHASGKINKGIGTPDVTLKNYGNCLEEARADLVGLYYIMDQKLVDIGVMPSIEVGKAQYDNYILNGLILQLTRIKAGDNLEEAHMRNRQLVAKWAYEKGKKDNVIEFVKKDGKTFVKVNDYQKLRVLFGELLKEIQKIKSEGDFKAGQALVEGYGVIVDKELHKEVLERFAKLNVAPYKGFIQPKLVPVMEGEKIVDVKIEYPKSFAEQMIEYGKKYSLLPLKN